MNVRMRMSSQAAHLLITSCLCAHEEMCPSARHVSRAAWTRIELLVSRGARYSQRALSIMRSLAERLEDLAASLRRGHLLQVVAESLYLFLYVGMAGESTFLFVIILTSRGDVYMINAMTQAPYCSYTCASRFASISSRAASVSSQAASVLATSVGL